MSSYDAEYPADSQQEPAPLNPEYRHPAGELFNTVMLAGEYAEKLKSNLLPFKIENELTVPEVLLSDSLELPESFRTINVPMKRLTFSFEKEYPPDAVNDPDLATLPLLKTAIHAEFYDSVSDDALPMWRAMLQAMPEECAGNKYKGAITPVNPLELPDAGAPYKIAASTKEVSQLVTSLLRFTPARVTESEEIIDPTDPLEALKIERIFTEALNAEQTLTTSFRVRHDELDYTVAVQWANDVPQSVTITRHNGTKIIIDEGTPHLSIEDDVFDVTMTTLNASVHTYIESDKSYEDDVDQQDQVTGVKKLIKQLLLEVPEINLAGSSLIDKEDHEDLEPEVSARQSHTLGTKDAADIDEARRTVEELFGNEEDS